MCKKILMSCYEVPGYGGANTTSYKLFEMLQKDGFDITYLNLIHEDQNDYFRQKFGRHYGNPKQLDNVHNCILHDKLFKSFPEITPFITNSTPDFILGMDHISAYLMKHAAPEKKLIFFTSGSKQVKTIIENKSAKNTIELLDFVEQFAKPDLTPDNREREAVKIADLIIPHSELIKSIYETIYAGSRGKICSDVIWKTEWIRENTLRFSHFVKPFSEREIDLLFVSSSWDRYIKNHELVEKVIHGLPDLNIHIVGEISRKLPNVVYHGLIPERERLLEIMGNSKSVICPSLFDASPGILFEGSVMGCNVITSKNCGNWQICNKELLIEPFTLDSILEKIRLSLIEKFDDNMHYFLKENSYQNLKDILNVYNLSFWGTKNNGKKDFQKNSLADTQKNNSMPVTIKESSSPKIFKNDFLHLSKTKKFIKKRILKRYLNYAYNFFVKNFSWWPIGLLRFKAQPSLQPKRIGYYLWKFPKLSQTFIQRELLTLKQAGCNIIVFADTYEPIELFNEDVGKLFSNSIYLENFDNRKLKEYQTKFFYKNPLRFLNLFIFLMSRRFTNTKNFDHDKVHFSKAIYLAGVLSEKKIEHIHAPWSDKFAFIALIASRLLGIPFTLQARAFDIHNKEFSFCLKEKFENAECIITNTRYNEVYIKKLLHKRYHRKLKVIYNGLDLSQFRPEQKNGDINRKVKILAVGRLVEQKGFTSLLKACKILIDKGCQFTCEIIGDKEEPTHSGYYLELKKLWLQLKLEETVFFRGPKAFEDVMTKYQSCDLVVLPCVIGKDGDRDITPNVLIEAMAMKLPVISTTLSGIPEIVDDAINGLLVPPADVDALADAMLRLIENVDQRKEFGMAGRKKIEERFDTRRNINNYIELFSDGSLTSN